MSIARQIHSIWPLFYNKVDRKSMRDVVFSNEAQRNFVNTKHPIVNGLEKLTSICFCVCVCCNCCVFVSLKTSSRQNIHPMMLLAKTICVSFIKFNVQANIVSAVYMSGSVIQKALTGSVYLYYSEKNVDTIWPFLMRYTSNIFYFNKNM